VRAAAGMFDRLGDAFRVGEYNPLPQWGTAMGVEFLI
jgi:hypothetical protein